MSTLVAVIFNNNENGATNALTKLRKLEKEYLIDLEDAVIVRREKEGKIKLEQSIDMSGNFALRGALWGSLIGLIFAGPLGMMVAGTAGAGFGALKGNYTDFGIDDNFIKDLSNAVEPDSSALFILIRKITADKVLEELNGIGGKIIKTSLSKDEEERLQQALQGEGK